MVIFHGYVSLPEGNDNILDDAIGIWDGLHGDKKKGSLVTGDWCDFSWDECCQGLPWV